MQTTEIDVPTEIPRSGARTRRTLIAVGAAAAAAAAAVTAGLVLTGDGKGNGQVAEEPTTLALSLPPSDVMASCLVFDVDVLAGMPVAFGGTVTAVGDGAVTLDVDRWFTGGDADVVKLALADGQTSAALDGVDFRDGERYLVTASQDGTVSGCGFSGPATPDLERSFETAFTG